MAKVEREQSELEVFVKPLLEAANTNHWRDALRILFVSGHVLSLYPSPIDLPCLVSAQGPYQTISRSADLLNGKANVAVTTLIGSALQIFLPKISVLMREETTLTQNLTEVSGEQAPTELQQSKLAMLMMAEVVPEIDKHKKELATIAIQGVSSLSDMITINILTSLLETRENHLHCTFDEDEYEEMIESLRRLGIIGSKLQVSLCPECTNYQFTISSCPCISDRCPKCGEDWVTAILYTFEDSYASIKIDNNDLPLFISRYLRYKMISGVLQHKVEIYPNAVVRIEDGKEAEIDVFIPEWNFGVECKVYEDVFAPMTDARMNNLKDKLLKQIHRYSQANISQILIVTNLTSSSAEKLQGAIVEALRQGGDSASIKAKVLSGDVEVLLSTLDEIASEIVKSINESTQRKFKPTEGLVPIENTTK